MGCVRGGGRACGSRTIRRLFVDVGRFVAVGVLRVSSAPGSREALAMMQRHQNAADLQRLGCMALCRVCAATCRASVPAARARVRLAIEAGGREVAWLAMQAYPAHEELQRRGQRVLDCLLDLPAPPADRGERPV